RPWSAGPLHLLPGAASPALPGQLSLDLIVSNPPYSPTADLPALQPEVSAYEPRQALDGGAGGIDFYRRIAADAAPFLKPSGKIMLEFGDSQAHALREIFEQQ